MMKTTRAKPIGSHTVFAVAPGRRGQGGIELWILTAWLDMSQLALAPFANHRVLFVSLHTLVGHIQVVVVPALDSSYPKDEIFVG